MKKIESLKKLTVFGQDLSIVRVPELARDHGLAGFYDPMKKEIHLDAAFKGDELAQVLLHEMGHALFDRAGIMQSKIPLELVEVIVETYATMIVESFKLTAK